MTARHRARPPGSAPVVELVIEVDTTVAVAELLERAAHAARVVIRVAAFTDGRFFSQVRALAESREFSGAIEVRGNLLPDQAQLLARYGVCEVVLENGLDLADRPRFINDAWRERRLARHRRG